MASCVRSVVLYFRDNNSHLKARTITFVVYNKTQVVSIKPASSQQLVHIATRVVNLHQLSEV